MAPIHKSTSGLTGFFTRTGMSDPSRASQISWTWKGLAVVRAPIHTMSTPASRQAFTWAAEPTSVHTLIPLALRASCNQARPRAPTPSKPPGCVRGFHRPARSTPVPQSLRACAASRTCSRLSALQGPATTKGLSPAGNSPHSFTGTKSATAVLYCKDIFLFSSYDVVYLLHFLVCNLLDFILAFVLDILGDK